MSVPDFSDVKTLPRFLLDVSRLPGLENINIENNINIYITEQPMYTDEWINSMDGYAIITGIQRAPLDSYLEFILLVCFKKCKGVICERVPYKRLYRDYILKLYPSDGFSFGYGRLKKTNICEFNISYKYPFPLEWVLTELYDVDYFDIAYVPNCLRYNSDMESQYDATYTNGEWKINDCVSVKAERFIFPPMISIKPIQRIMRRNYLRRKANIIQLLGNN